MAVECVAGSHVAPEERFDFFWRQQGEWVEEPNRRRGGESGVQRVISPNGRLLYSKRQTGHIYRSWLHPFGRANAMPSKAFARWMCACLSWCSAAPAVTQSTNGKRCW